MHSLYTNSYYHFVHEAVYMPCNTLLACIKGADNELIVRATLADLASHARSFVANVKLPFSCLLRL